MYPYIAIGVMTINGVFIDSIAGHVQSPNIPNPKTNHPYPITVKQRTNAAMTTPINRLARPKAESIRSKPISPNH